MQVWISDPHLVSDLIDFLQRTSCRAVHTRGHTVEVELPHAAAPEQAVRELGLYLAAWQGLHPGVLVDFAGRSVNAAARYTSAPTRM
jgi:hypothetical protein